MHSRTFTLIELRAAIAITSVLVSLLMPALSAVKAKPGTCNASRNCTQTAFKMLAYTLRR